jgi:hypothetical protein
MYNAARISLRLSLPKTSIIARPCASVLEPSSSLPPSSKAFPEVPATWTWKKGNLRRLTKGTCKMENWKEVK